MKKNITMFVVAACFASSVFMASSDTVSAKKISNVAQVKKMALNKVKGAVIEDVDKEYNNGTLCYEVDLEKGSKDYELCYRVSDGKLISYKCEEADAKESSKKLLSKSACKKLALKQIKGGTVTGITMDEDDDIEVCKVKMKKGKKRYELKYHARTGKLLECKWSC